MSAAFPDRLAILNVSGAQENTLFTNLAEEKFTFTVINSTGGMIQESEISLLIGFQSERFQYLLDILKRNCRPYRQYVSARGFMQAEMANLPMVEAQVGGAEIYLMNVERFEQI